MAALDTEKRHNEVTRGTHNEATRGTTKPQETQRSHKRHNEATRSAIQSSEATAARAGKGEHRRGKTFFKAPRTTQERGGRRDALDFTRPGRAGAPASMLRHATPSGAKRRRKEARSMRNQSAIEIPNPHTPGGDQNHIASIAEEGHRQWSDTTTKPRLP